MTMVSICIFGSVARKTTDEVSDRDILIVGENLDDCMRAEHAWKSSGWNATCFTRGHLIRMAEFGSLFIQHLKQEGLILEDDGFLAELFSRFQPRADYKEQLFHALEPLDWAAGFTTWTRLCACDILFVSLRNVGVLESAMRGNCVFDFDRIVKLLGTQCSLEDREEIALSRLRRYKFAYRSRDPKIVDSTEWKLIVNATQKIRVSFFDKYGAIKVGLGEVSDFRPNKYNQLRRAELTIVKDKDPRYLDSLLPGDPTYELWRLICQPADYPKLQQFSFTRILDPVMKLMPKSIAN